MTRYVVPAKRLLTVREVSDAPAVCVVHVIGSDCCCGACDGDDCVLVVGAGGDGDGGGGDMSVDEPVDDPADEPVSDDDRRRPAETSPTRTS